MNSNETFNRFSHRASKLLGSSYAFIIALVIVIAWLATGPIFGFSDTWQLIINTGTTVVTFLQVFLIQNTQNRDGAAIQAKLDELIRASAAQNRYIGIEELTEEELNDLRKVCATRAKGERLAAAQQAADEKEEHVNRKAAEAAARAAGS